MPTKRPKETPEQRAQRLADERAAYGPTLNADSYPLEDFFDRVEEDARKMNDPGPTKERCLSSELQSCS